MPNITTPAGLLVWMGCIYAASAILMLTHVFFVLRDWKHAASADGAGEFHWISSLWVLVPEELCYSRYLYKGPDRYDVNANVVAALTPLLNTALAIWLLIWIACGTLRRAIVEGLFGTEDRYQAWLHAGL